YLEECRATHEANISQEDVCLSAYRLPSVSEMHRLVEVLDRSAYPIFLHCRRGADRTGLVSAVVLLLQTDTRLADARRQLGLRFGHVALGRTASLDGFLDLYADWLTARGLTHSRENFRRWLEHDYWPGAGRCRLEALAVPARIPGGEPFALRVRSHNLGTQTWKFQAGANAGIHAGFIVYDAQDHEVVEGRGGLFDAEVAPGQSMDLTLALPALKGPSHFRVLVDMVEEQQGWFYQAGSEPLEQELEVGP
ncbi:MAG: tyrosine-protein phosphatase, partial [Planctomycetes bacterium]|nr:tyrosine-protein phosphatase [Planctomycetota bacterium]